MFHSHFIFCYVGFLNISLSNVCFSKIDTKFSHPSIASDTFYYCMLIFADLCYVEKIMYLELSAMNSLVLRTRPNNSVDVTCSWFEFKQKLLRNDSKFVGLVSLVTSFYGLLSSAGDKLRCQDNSLTRWPCVGFT